VKLERGFMSQPKEGDTIDLASQVGRQAIDQKRQDIGAKGVADEQHALFLPVDQVVS
jgi:hypothetical protein